MSFGQFGRAGELDNWSQRIEDLMDEMRHRDFFEFRAPGTWQPTTDVYETHDAYYICADLAGMDPADVSIDCLEECQVSISGVRPAPRPAEVEGVLNVHAMEVQRGPFRRTVTLPEAVTPESIVATYDKGLLWIKLLKRAP